MDTLAPAPVVGQHERSSRMRAAAVAALHWPLNLWLESLLRVALSPGVSYTVSYTSLAAVAGAFGYGSWERWLAPLAIDVPLAASVLGQLLAARWRPPWWAKALLLSLVAWRDCSQATGAAASSARGRRASWLSTRRRSGA